MNFATSFRVGSRVIGSGHPVFVIAEAGVNHNGSLDMARALVDAAAEAGADAVKFQTFKAERVVSADAAKADYQKETTDRTESQAEMIRRLELSEANHHALVAHCAARGILFLSTPFDEESADFLTGLGVPAFKTSSGDLTNHPFLAHLARTGLPIIFSTGMSTLEEVEEAVRAMASADGRELAILHCVSDYPTNPVHVNLRAMDTLAAAFGVPIGFSDHTLGAQVAIAAVARGATVIEKHLTLDKTLPGPDHRASFEPGELKQMIADLRLVESALGDGVKIPRGPEIGNLAIGRKSLHWSRTLPAGAVVAADDFIMLRPGTGLRPALRDSLLGRRLARAVNAGALVCETDLNA